MSVKVSFPDLFKNEKHAGLQYEEWLSLSSSEQLTERLMFVHNRAEALAVSIKSTPDHELHYVYTHTLRLKEQVHKCLELLSSREIFESMEMMIDIGKTMQQIKSLPATHEALSNWQVDLTTVYEMRARGGVKGAAHKKAESEENRQLILEAYEYFISKNVSERDLASKIAKRVNDIKQRDNKGDKEVKKFTITTRTVRNHLKEMKVK